MVTAELAACLPVLVLVIALALSAMQVAGARVRVQDAAREAARSMARHDPGDVHELVAHAAPGATVTVSQDGDQVRAVVSLRVHLLTHWLPAATVTERAVAALEPDGG